jgi:hypothetical protein
MQLLNVFHHKSLPLKVLALCERDRQLGGATLLHHEHLLDVNSLLATLIIKVKVKHNLADLVDSRIMQDSSRIEPAVQVLTDTGTQHRVSTALLWLWATPGTTQLAGTGRNKPAMFPNSRQ